MFNELLIEDKSCKRLSYGASFGVNNWEFSPKESVRCRQLIQRFDAVSVREASGLDLCASHLHRSAVKVLDPTMLLDVSHYVSLISKQEDINLHNNLLVYLFDKSTFVNSIISTLANRYNLTVNQFAPQHSGKVQILPSVSEWLQNIRSSKIVLTDSFHACVFSILFNTPFYVVSNSLRGNARIDSLLADFDLRDRLVSDIIDIKDYNNIDWEKVNARIKDMKVESLLFLQSVLKS